MLMSEYVKKKLGKRMIDPSRARVMVELSVMGSEYDDKFLEKMMRNIRVMVNRIFVSLRNASNGWTFRGWLSWRIYREKTMGIMIEKIRSNRWSSLEYDGVLKIRKRMTTAIAAKTKGARQSSGAVSNK